MSSIRKAFETLSPEKFKDFYKSRISNLKLKYTRKDVFLNQDIFEFLYKNNLLDDFKYKEKVVNIPVASEYTANHETFKINENELSSIWRKNPVYCRWSFEGSISANDYPYLLNNSDIY